MFKCAACILTIRDSKKHPKLHKYTVKLYKYAVLRGLLLGEERNAIWWESQIFPIKNPPLMDRIYFKLKSEKFGIAPWWVLLYTPKLATLHLDGCFFALLPPLNFLESKYIVSFFLILNELHSAAENFTFLTKTNYIPYENTLHSLPECTSFS